MLDKPIEIGDIVYQMKRGWSGVSMEVLELRTIKAQTSIVEQALCRGARGFSVAGLRSAKHRCMVQWYATATLTHTHNSAIPTYKEVEMTEPRTISVIDLIVDVPGYTDLRAVADKLGHSKINGHDVLLIQHSSIHRNDAVDIPHAGHSQACELSPEKCRGQELASGIKYKRYFFLQAIVDGAFRLGDMETVDFRLDGTLVIVSSVSIEVQPDEVNRTTLLPWESNTN